MFWKIRGRVLEGGKGRTGRPRCGCWSVGLGKLVPLWWLEGGAAVIQIRLVGFVDYGFWTTFCMRGVFMASLRISLCRLYHGSNYNVKARPSSKLKR